MLRGEHNAFDRNVHGPWHSGHDDGLHHDSGKRDYWCFGGKRNGLDSPSGSGGSPIGSPTSCVTRSKSRRSKRMLFEQRRDKQRRDSFSHFDRPLVYSEHVNTGQQATGCCCKTALSLCLVFLVSALGANLFVLVSLKPECFSPSSTTCAWRCSDSGQGACKWCSNDWLINICTSESGHGNSPCSAATTCETCLFGGANQDPQGICKVDSKALYDTILAVSCILLVSSLLGLCCVVAFLWRTMVEEDLDKEENDLFLDEGGDWSDGVKRPLLYRHPDSLGKGEHPVFSNRDVLHERGGAMYPSNEPLPNREHPVDEEDAFLTPEEYVEKTFRKWGYST